MRTTPVPPSNTLPPGSGDAAGRGQSVGVANAVARTVPQDVGLAAGLRAQDTTVRRG
jgi:hypothetical protein